MRPTSCVATTVASWAGVKVESTERASLGPTPEMAISRSKSARSSRVAKPKRSTAPSRTTIRVSSVTPASPTAGRDAAVDEEMPSS